MNGYMHKQMTVWACLAAGKKNPVWLRDMEATAQASVYPDLCTAGEKDPNSSSWDPLWKPLILIPQEDGTKQPVHSVFVTQKLRETYPTVLRYEIELAVSAFRRGEEELGRKAVGIISHVIGDTVQAAHTTDNVLINWMYAQPDKRFNIHAFIEGTMSPLPYEEEYETRVMGSISTLVWRLVEELEIARRKSIAEIPKLMDGLLYNHPQKAQASAKRSALLGCKLIADTMASVSAIVDGVSPFEPVVDLTELIPCAWEVDSMFNYEPMVNGMPSQDIDRMTQLDVGEGPVSGIALLPMLQGGYRQVRKSFASYILPGDPYKTFRTKIGLQRFSSPADIPKMSRANETKAVFEIQLDGTTVFRSVPLGDDMPPVAVIVPLAGAKVLTLYVRDAREPDPITKFFYPVFAKPEILY